MGRKKKLQGKFQRDTRGKKITPSTILEMKKLKCSIFLLDSEKGMTLDEIIEAHERHDKTNPTVSLGYKPTQIEKGLQELVALELVKEI